MGYIIVITIIIFLFIFADWFAKMVSDAIKSLTASCKKSIVDQIDDGKIAVEKSIAICSSKLKSNIEGVIDQKSQAFQDWLDGLRKWDR